MNSKQRQNLRAKAHKLKPVVLLGQHGLTENVILAIEEALSDHELIKVKAADKESQQAIIDEVCPRLKAEQVQSIGRTVTLYRKNPE